MLMSPNIAKCSDARRADSNLPLLKLAEAQDHREPRVVAPLIERLESVADALGVVLIFNCDERTLQRRLERELFCLSLIWSMMCG